MHIITVIFNVRPESIGAFRSATMENAANSLQEAGVVRFDLLQQADDPHRFMLFEVYRTPEDHAKHRQTAHYRKWRDGTAEMVEEPRTVARYVNAYPGDESWKK